MKSKIIQLGCIISSFLMGCTSLEMGEDEPKSTNTYVVIVGMENSMFAGSCPGARIDSSRMHALLSSYTSNITLLQDKQATKKSVTTALEKSIKEAENGLVIFYYSGHGGSQRFADTDAEEVDGQDEYYCLWDTWFKDNEMWNIISQSKGRVMLINDCCHSETLFREPKISLKQVIPLSTSRDRETSFSLLCWSGCPDNTYSYGSSTGGQFTNALLRHFKPNKTYEYLWNEIKKDSVLREYEDPQKTEIGIGFTGKCIFR